MTVYQSNAALLLTAIIWGLAFVAQRAGMDYVGPFTYNGIRFALGSMSLLPLIFYLHHRTAKEQTLTIWADFRHTLPYGLLAGAVLFAGASLQQIGLMYTTAGKAAFITCLYIILVPLLGLILKRPVKANTLAGGLLALTGLYLLCVRESLTLAWGDLLELTGAFFWAIHILLIDHFVKKVDVLKLSCLQCIACSLFSLTVALFTENFVWSAITAAATPILYGGLASVGIAYTLQLVGQKNAPPAHAAVILSMETVFAAIGGFFLLAETLGSRELLGCAIMLIGMLTSQLGELLPGKSSKPLSLPK